MGSGSRPCQQAPLRWLSVGPPPRGRHAGVQRSGDEVEPDEVREIVGARRLANPRAQLLDLGIVRAPAIQTLGEDGGDGRVVGVVADRTEGFQALAEDALLGGEVSGPELDLGVAEGHPAGGLDEPRVEVRLPGRAVQFTRAIDVALHCVQTSENGRLRSVLQQAGVGCPERD